MDEELLRRADQYEAAHTINELRSKLSDRDVDYDQGASKRELAERLAKYVLDRQRRGRRGADAASLDDVMIGDTLTNRWGQKWKAREFRRSGLLIERLDRSGVPTSETKVITSLDGWSVRTPGDTKRHWSDYESEGGHHIM